MAREFCKDRIVEYGMITVVPPFVLVEVSCRTGPETLLRAVGEARCSSEDDFNSSRGIEIAKGRALKALDIKLRGREIPGHQVYMG